MLRQYCVRLSQVKNTQKAVLHQYWNKTCILSVAFILDEVLPDFDFSGHLHLVRAVGHELRRPTPPANPLRSAAGVARDMSLIRTWCVCLFVCATTRCIMRAPLHLGDRLDGGWWVTIVSPIEQPWAFFFYPLSGRIHLRSFSSKGKVKNLPPFSTNLIPLLINTSDCLHGRGPPFTSHSIWYAFHLSSA